MWELWILKWTAHPNEEMYGFEKNRINGIKMLKKASGCKLVEALRAMDGLDNGVPFKLGAPKVCTDENLGRIAWHEVIEWLSNGETEWRYSV